MIKMSNKIKRLYFIICISLTVILMIIPSTGVYLEFKALTVEIEINEAISRGNATYILGEASQDVAGGYISKGGDINGDGIINDNDKTVIGSSNPEHYGGIGNTFRYKRWTLNGFMQFVTGNEVFNYVRAQNESMISHFFINAPSVIYRFLYMRFFPYP